jgi:hypothetical protein
MVKAMAYFSPLFRSLMLFLPPETPLEIKYIEKIKEVTIKSSVVIISI